MHTHTHTNHRSSSVPSVFGGHHTRSGTKQTKAQPNQADLHCGGLRLGGGCCCGGGGRSSGACVVAHEVWHFLSSNGTRDDGFVIWYACAVLELTPAPYSATMTRQSMGYQPTRCRCNRFRSRAPSSYLASKESIPVLLVLLVVVVIAGHKHSQQHAAGDVCIYLAVQSRELLQFGQREHVHTVYLHQCDAGRSPRSTST